MKTKVIATIGPASLDLSIIKKLIEAGVNIFRINTKYGSTSQYLQIVDNIKAVDHAQVMFDIKDDKHLAFLQNQQFDYLAVSFAESATQIEKYKKLFDKYIKIIAKIETKKGIKNIDEIIDASDGILVARGDLSRNIPAEEVPIMQKIIIKKCNAKNKFVITATEMLLSMVQNSLPEKAEISDVANAVLDGTNAVMLSEETAIGTHPVLAAETMVQIVKKTLAKQKLLSDFSS